MYLIKPELSNIYTLNHAYQHYSVDPHIFGCLRAGMCRKIYVTYIIFCVQNSKLYRLLLLQFIIRIFKSI